MKIRTVALCISDMHLSHVPPSARCTERKPEADRKAWYAAMRRQITEVDALSAQHGYVPVIVAGDIFHTHKEPAEIVNRVIRWLTTHTETKWHAVPGQHDLPNHDYAQIKKSCYWTLVESGRIINVAPGEPVEIPGAFPIRLHGFPFGFPVTPLADPHDLLLEVAVVHAYCWMKGKGFPGAPEENKISKYKLGGYDAAVFGDNHQHFHSKTVWNCGAFLRRNADEQDHRPVVGLLQSDGTIKSHYLNCKKDTFADPEVGIVEASNLDLSQVFSELRASQEKSITLREALERWLLNNPASENVRRDINEAME